MNPTIRKNCHRGLRGGWTALSAVLLSASLAGCGAAPAPPELVSARASFARAQGSSAARLVPTKVYEAKKALDLAEQAYLEEGGDEPKTRDLAYIAERQASLAQAEARVAEAIAERDQARKNVLAVQQEGLTRAQLEARRAEQAVRQAKGELSKREAELQQKGKELEQKGSELAKERAAREAAEARAKEAMARLAVANALAIKDEPRGTVITVPSGVLFESGKFALLAGARSKLDPIAEALKQHEDHKIIVEGHTDSQGTDESNLELGQKRAQAVRDYVVSQGVKADQITAVGIGEGRPVADNSTAEGRANNRRVEIIVKRVEAR